MQIVKDEKADLLIYYTRTDRPLPDDLLHKYLSALPEFLHSQILSYRRWQDRQAALLGKMLLLRALMVSDPTTGRGKLQSLQVTRYGKPFIPGGPEFNISHFGEMVVLVVNNFRAGPVGIDIEKIRDINLEVFSQYFSLTEKLQEIGDTNQMHHQNFDLWTQKEAFLKACGLGLSIGSERIDMQRGAVFFAGTHWFIKKIILHDEYSCHIATDQQLNHISIYKWRRHL